MKPWPHIPEDAVDWFRAAFRAANLKVSERLLNSPNIRETSLDDGLVEALVPWSAPRLLASNAVVKMDIHNIGGLRRLRRWETADIAILIFVYSARTLIAQKIGLLQSKRLYPLNNDVESEDPVGFMYGMNEFLDRDASSPLALLHRTYEFTDTCVYGALEAANDQNVIIMTMNSDFGEVVYYLLYNPPRVPATVSYPVSAYKRISRAPLGCRVFSQNDIIESLGGLTKGSSPTLKQINRAGKNSNWRLEEWAADLLLRCKVGQPFDADRKEQVRRLLERRTGPIGAAIAVSIALPEDHR